MPSLSSDARFFGIDLKALWQDIRLPWQRALHKPPLSWLTPSVPVVLLHADAGAEAVKTVWLGDLRVTLNPREAKAAFLAVELPEEQLLRRQLRLPAMAAADMAGAAELEARTHSPFPAQDLAWGCRETAAWSGLVQVEVVVASRRQIGQYLAGLAPQLGRADIPEVWARSSDDGLPIVLRGYGEERRHAVMRRGRAVNCALLASIALLLAAIAVTPTLQLRQRALQAVRAYDDAVQRTAATARQREALMHSIEKVDALSQTLSGRIEPLRVFDRLTQVLPDDTAVQSFRLQGVKVTIAGDTSNASTLLRLLGEQAGIGEVRAPTAATRLPGAAKESYVIEFVVDPQIFGIARGANVQPAGAVLPQDAEAVPPKQPPVREGAVAPAPPSAGSAGNAPVATFGGTRPSGATPAGGRKP